jgi:hypothetical protein
MMDVVAPPKQLIGSITKHHERKWTVQVPADRDATGKLIYQRETINGPKRDAVACRDRILASVDQEKVAPFQRKRTPRPSKPGWLLRLVSRLRLYRVELLDPEMLRVRCAVCKLEWAIERTPGGGLPRLYWRCPGIAPGACVGGFSSGPSRREVINAVSLGVGGRPPICEWTHKTVKGYYPGKLSDAELVALWERFDRSEPRFLLHNELITRGLWRHALRRHVFCSRAYCSQAGIFIETTERILRSCVVAPAPGTRAAAAIANAKTIEESGLLAYLRQALRDIEEIRRKTGGGSFEIRIPEGLLI